ncbi:prephenate dehydratase [uncultured Clostridium sp.]|uniref:prephenate dehydratase n=1 Tax=uncultured Clostridium sp. TaxID=59620 RepID=UPI0025DB7924|nr:prephenate dehydratase [uncultured Clostridium sp.]
MADLDDYRVRIDEIDREITRLFEERMDVVLNVAKYKIDNGLPIFHRDREEQVIEKNAGYLKNKDYTEELKEFYTYLMEVSRHLQNRKFQEAEKNGSIEEVKKTKRKKTKKYDPDKKVGFFGVSGSFTEEGMMKFFGDVKNPKAYDEFEDVFMAVKNDEIDYGVVPIENSSTGAIAQVYDLLYKYDFYIVGEQCVRVEQNIVGIKGTTLDDVKEVYSHPQPFAQSTEFLKCHPEWKLIPFHSTSVSAKLVSDLKEKSKVAIASKRAAEIYNLDVIKENINNQSQNTTRFIIISKNLESDETCDKVSVVFSIDDKAGTLYKLISHFAENNINMIKIESRPMEEGTWNYFLYVDFDGNIDSPEVITALDLIKQNSTYFKLLGGYKKNLI